MSGYIGRDVGYIGIQEETTSEYATEYFYTNKKEITENASIPSGLNAVSAGPITVADGVVVDIPEGTAWTVV